MTEIIAGIVFLLAWAAFLWSQIWIQNRQAQNLQRERNQWMKMIQDSHLKLASRSMAEYASTKIATQQGKQPQNYPYPGTMTPSGPNGEFVTDPETEAAIEYQAKYGVSFQEARDKIRKGAPTAAGPIGNEPLE